MGNFRKVIIIIEIRDVTFSYSGREKENGVKNINLKIPKGQVLILCGKSGCGKTTITRLINGLIPKFYEGNLQGEVWIDDINVSQEDFNKLAPIVGSVFQNPRSQFFNVDTTGEIAFGCENVGVPSDEICKRMGRIIKELSLEKLLNRNLFKLSGGEKQKIACASVAALEPDIFILDEPSSNLDVCSIEKLRGIIELWKSKGKTIVIAEHRLYYLMDVADRVIYMADGKIVEDYNIFNFRKIEEAKLKEKGLRNLNKIQSKVNSLKDSKSTIVLKNFVYEYNHNKMLDILELKLPKEAVIGILGNNGAGKTTFARYLCGLIKKTKGEMICDGRVYKAKDRLKSCYMVMQDVNHQLFTESVIDEILLSMEDDIYNRESKAINILTSLNLENFKELHPMALSGGQKQRVAIASAIASNKNFLIFDEPTSGLDYECMVEVSKLIKALQSKGKPIFIVTHDFELIDKVCNFLIFLEKGKIKWSGYLNDKREELNEFFNL